MADRKLMAGGAVLLGAAGFWFGIKPEFIDQAPPPEYTEEEIADAPRPTVTLEESVFNLLAPSSGPAYVKLELAMEFADPNRHYLGESPAAVEELNAAFAEDLQPEMHKINDVLNRVVGGKSIEDVSTPGGRETLKDELIEGLNDVLGDERVTELYFVTFITQ